jgi:UrcA family protein
MTMRVLFAPLFARLLVLLRVLGPYAVVELLLPGGTLIALLYWWYRNRQHGSKSTPLHEEIRMYAKTTFLRTRPLLGAVLACMLFSGALAAQDHNVTVALPVSAKGLDLTRTTDAQTFYTRLKNAAWVACTRGNRVDLAPVDDFKGCYEKALGDAVRSAKTPLVTQIYLSSHTIREAVAHGIEIPAQMAGR